MVCKVSYLGAIWRDKELAEYPMDNLQNLTKNSNICRPTIYKT